MFTGIRCLLITLAISLILPSMTQANEHHEGGDHDSQHDDEPFSLHFSHPLIAESPSPDTKARFDYVYERIHEGIENARQHTLRFEGEYAFHPAFSVEIDAPFVFFDDDGASSESNFGTTEIGFKVANFLLADYGILLGYGLELGLPTGDENKGIGSNNELEIEPFFDVGLKCNDLELVGFISFGIPTNHDKGEEVENEFGFNISSLYHFSSRFIGVLEIDGETELNGHGEGHTVTNLTPGVKFQPFENTPLDIGVGVSVPLTGRENFEIRSIVSAFYHF